MFDEIRKGLAESYQHRKVAGHVCHTCGSSEGDLALHVIEFWHPDEIETPLNLVPMSRSRGVTRGAVPICRTCCPPCKKCSIPIATKWVAAVKGLLQHRHQDVRFRIGNGYCQHIHPLHDLKAMFRKATLPTTLPPASQRPRQEIPRVPPRAEGQPQALQPRSANSPEQVGYMLSMLLTNATCVKGAELMANALDLNLDTPDSRKRLISELAPLNTSHIIIAVSAAFPEPVAQRVLDSFLKSASATLFDDISSRHPDFPDRYETRMAQYDHAFSEEHAPTAVAETFLRNFGIDPTSNPERTRKVSQALGAFFNSTLGMLKEQRF